MSAQPPSPPTSEIARLCHRKVTTIGPGEDVVEAARLMRTSHNGFLVVCEPLTADGAGDSGKRVIGVLTDRDIVVAVVARDADPHQLKVADVMTRHPLMVGEDCTLEAMLGFMHGAGVRRVPVLGSRNELVGVVSLDDVTERVAQQLISIAGAYRAEQRTERLVRP